MLHICVQKFDVMGNLEIFWKLLTKSRNIKLQHSWSCQSGRLYWTLDHCSGLVSTCSEIRTGWMGSLYWIGACCRVTSKMLGRTWWMGGSLQAANWPSASHVHTSTERPTGDGAAGMRGSTHRPPGLRILYCGRLDNFIHTSHQQCNNNADPCHTS